jgi:hypothetical protein
MLIKTSGYRLYDIDKGEVANLWMPVKNGLDRPNAAYLESLKLLRASGVYVLEPGQMAGASGFSGGGGGGTDTNTFVMSGSNHAGLNPTPAGTTYYIPTSGAPATTVPLAYQHILPVTATLTKHYWYVHVNGVASVDNGSADPADHYIRQNDSADGTGATLALYSVGLNRCNATESRAFTANDYFVPKIVISTSWSTLPTSVRMSWSAYFTV